MVGDVDRPLNPLETHGIYAEGNMENILETILDQYLHDP
jgi:hypothetical protein